MSARPTISENPYTKPVSLSRRPHWVKLWIKCLANWGRARFDLSGSRSPDLQGISSDFERVLPAYSGLLDVLWRVLLSLVIGEHRPNAPSNQASVWRICRGRGLPLSSIRALPRGTNLLANSQGGER